MSAGVQFSVIMVSFNTKDMTLAALRTLFAETRSTTFEVFVVDNDSQDGSAEAIAAHFPQVRLWALKQNLGFGAANNFAAEHASGKRLLLLNPDTGVRARAVDRLWEFAEAQPAARLWGGRTTFEDGRLNAGSCWGAATPWSALSLALGLASAFPRSGLFHPEGLGPWLRDTERDVDIVSGCFMAIDKDLWDDLGGFHPDFFMYGEDADLCLRAQASGARPRITPTATIVHHGGASERVRADKMVRLFTAKAQLYKKYWGPRRARFGCRTLDLWALHRTCAFRVLSLVSKRRKASYDAWRDVWRRRGEWRAAFDRTERYISAARPAADHREFPNLRRTA